MGSVAALVAVRARRTSRSRSPSHVPPGSRVTWTSIPPRSRWLARTDACVVLPDPSGPSIVMNQPRPADAFGRFTPGSVARSSKAETSIHPSAASAAYPDQPRDRARDRREGGCRATCEFVRPRSDRSSPVVFATRHRRASPPATPAPGGPRPRPGLRSSDDPHSSPRRRTRPRLGRGPGRAGRRRSPIRSATSRSTTTPGSGSRRTGSCSTSSSTRRRSRHSRHGSPWTPTATASCPTQRPKRHASPRAGLSRRR